MARSKIWFEVEDQFAIGEGGIDLLRAIATVGSLTGAAQQVGWSYRHAWGYIRRAERVLDMSLVATRPGKGRTRGATLTRKAHRLIAVFHLLSTARSVRIHTSTRSRTSL